MSTRKRVEKEVTLYRSLNDQIDALLEVRDGIPEECREDTTVEIIVEHEYDCEYVKIEVSYYRPETPVEETERLSKQKQANILQKERQLRQLRTVEEKLND